MPTKDWVGSLDFYRSVTRYLNTLSRVLSKRTSRKPERLHPLAISDLPHINPTYGITKDHVGNLDLWPKWIIMRPFPSLMAGCHRRSSGDSLLSQLPAIIRPPCYIDSGDPTWGIWNFQPHLEFIRRLSLSVSGNQVGNLDCCFHWQWWGNIFPSPVTVVSGKAS